jgi:hypothetical protein
MTYSKKNDPIRRLRSAGKLLWLMFRSAVLCTLVTGAYAALKFDDKMFIHFDPANLGVDITNLAVLYNLFAAATVALIVEKFPKLSRAVLKREKEEFLLLRDERLSLTLNLITGSVAVILLYAMGCRDNASFISGVAAIGGMSFIMAMIFIGVSDLQDLRRSPWFSERVPADWWTASVDDTFLRPIEPESDKRD